MLGYLSHHNSRITTPGRRSILQPDPAHPLERIPLNGHGSREPRAYGGCGFYRKAGRGLPRADTVEGACDKGRRDPSLPIDIPATNRVRAYQLAVVLLATGIFVIDTFTSLGIAIAVLYTSVVILSAAFLTPRRVLIVGAICVFLTLLSFLIVHVPGFEPGAVLRCTISLCAVVLTTFLSLKNMEATQHLRNQAALLELTHDAIYVRDAEDVITYWNRGAEDLYGWSAVEARGRKALELLKTQLPVPLAAIEASLARSGRWEGALTQTRRDGSVLIVSSRWSLQRTAGATPAATMVTNNDITERRRAIERLRETEEELRRVVDTIPGMVWSSSPDDGSVVYVNARCADMGWTFDDVQGSKWQAIVHPDDLPKLEANWARSLATGQLYENVARFRQASGEYRWMLARAAALRDDITGKILRWYGIANDIEDRRRTEEALLQTQADVSHVARIVTLGELTASITHQVDQPLAAVVSNGEAGLRWLSRDPPNVEAVRAAVERMIANARRASEVIAQMRALARRAEPECRPVDVNELVDDVLLRVQREISSHRITLRLAIDPSTPSVCGDRVQLLLVLINLVINALQAMTGLEDQARILRICTRRESGEDGEKACIEVIDSGPGFAGIDATTLFTPFYTTKQSGLGIGLSICRSIVEAHHGQISASAKDDAGATFAVRLPAWDEEHS